MPKYSGGVSWKFSNNDGDQESNLIVKDRFARERYTKDNNMSEDGNTTPEHCLKPSQAFAAFGGCVKTPKNEQDKSKESPKEAPKKKKTTFTWTPANQEELNTKDEDASKENTSISDVNVCDSIDKSSSQDTFQADAQTDVKVDHDAPVDTSNDAENIQPSVPRNDSVDHNGPNSTSPCEEPSSSPAPVLDANANPEQHIPANNQSMDPNDSKIVDEPTGDVPSPPSTEESKAEHEVVPTKDQSDAGEPAASPVAGNENVEQPYEETEGSYVVCFLWICVTGLVK